MRLERISVARETVQRVADVGQVVRFTEWVPKRPFDRQRLLVQCERPAVVADLGLGNAHVAEVTGFARTTADRAMQC